MGRGERGKCHKGCEENKEKIKEQLVIQFTHNVGKEHFMQWLSESLKYKPSTPEGENPAMNHCRDNCTA